MSCATTTPLALSVRANAAGAAMPANARTRVPESSERSTGRIRPASQHSAGTTSAVSTGTPGATRATVSTTAVVETVARVAPGVQDQAGARERGERLAQGAGGQ